MALAHCPVCDLWLTERQSCLHIGNDAPRQFAEPSSGRTETTAEPTLLAAVETRGADTPSLPGPACFSEVKA